VYGIIVNILKEVLAEQIQKRISDGKVVYRPGFLSFEVCAAFGQILLLVQDGRVCILENTLVTEFLVQIMRNCRAKRIINYQRKGFERINMLDFKKEKELYQPKTIPSIVHIPEMIFLAVDGKGDPNTGAEYKTAVEALFGLSWAIKMGSKSVLEYVVAPLEGFWEVDDEFKGGGAPINDKSKFIWTSVIRQPDFVTEEIFEITKAALKKKKPNLDLSKARLIKHTEGMCVQAMHIGSYDGEPATIALIEQYAIEQGYEIDINENRRHHEIYFSDPRKVAAEKLKTIIRHPIKTEV
jgi:hypothetical protein